MTDERAQKEEIAPWGAPPVQPDRGVVGASKRADQARWGKLQEALTQKWGPLRLAAVQPLGGGVSAQTLALKFVSQLQSDVTVVVKLPLRDTAPGRRQAASCEYQILTCLRDADVGAPRPLLLDVDDSILGQPGLVLEHLPGDVDVSPTPCEPMLRQMAERLAEIHGLGLARFGAAPLASQHAVVMRLLDSPPASFDHALNERTVRQELSKVRARLQPGRQCLLHGDYWPGNLLWSKGRLVGVLDWEEAAIGDPLADLAIARLDVLWAFGQHAMEFFTEVYAELYPGQMTHLPVWDLVAALRPMSRLHQWSAALIGPPIERPDLTPETLATKHRCFVELALSRL